MSLFNKKNKAKGLQPNSGTFHELGKATDVKMAYQAEEKGTL